MHMENTREIQLNDGGHVHSAAIIGLSLGFVKPVPICLGLWRSNKHSTVSTLVT